MLLFRNALFLTLMKNCEVAEFGSLVLAMAIVPREFGTKGWASFWIGAFVGIYLLFFKKDKFALSTEIPFGPFMVLALFVAWYFGEFALSFMPFVL